MDLIYEHPYLETLNFEEKIFIELTKTVCDLDKIWKLISKDINWEKVVKNAITHGVGTIVYENMLKCGLTINVDPQVLLILKICHSRNKQIKRLYREELRCLSAEFSKRKLKIVLLKGAALDGTIYPENVRDYTDIDLLLSDENLDIFYTILSKNGYRAEYKKKTLTQKEWIHLCTLRDGAVCEFKKLIRGVDITFDIHRFSDNNSECLNYVYDSAYRSEKLFDFYIPDNYHMLIFAGFHAWRHYPYTYRIKSLYALMTIKHLMDIREIYCTIKDRMQLNKLLYREEAYDVVYEMLYLANRIYGDLDIGEILPKIQHDYCSTKIVSRFEERLFRPDKEKEKLVLIEKEMKKDIRYPSIPCVSLGDCPVDIELHEIWKDIYGSILVQIEEANAVMRFIWNKEYFMLQGIIYEHASELGQTDNYEENQAQIYLIFCSDWENRYMLQMKKRGQHVLYRLNENLLNIKKITKAVIDGNIEKEHYSLDVKIPWEELAIIPREGVEFAFTFSVQIGKKKEFFYKDLTISDYDKRIVLQ